MYATRSEPAALRSNPETHALSAGSIAGFTLPSNCGEVAAHFDDVLAISSRDREDARQDRAAAEQLGEKV